MKQKTNALKKENCGKNLKYHTVSHPPLMAEASILFDQSPRPNLPTKHQECRECYHENFANRDIFLIVPKDSYFSNLTFRCRG